MALADRCNIAAGIALLVVVLINHGDNLLLRQVVDVGVAGYVERAGLHRSNTFDEEACLLVGQAVVAVV